MVFETKEQIIRRRKLARFKFRFLARKAFLNKSWLSELDDDVIGEDVKKNVAIILKRSHRKGAVTIIEKRILKKHWKSRSNEEEEALQKLFDNLPCFQTFAPVSLCKKLLNVFYKIISYSSFVKNSSMLSNFISTLKIKFFICKITFVNRCFSFSPVKLLFNN